MKYNYSADNYEILLFPEVFFKTEVKFKSIPRKSGINHKVFEIIESEWDKYVAAQIAAGKHDYLTITSLFRYEGNRHTNKEIIINVSQTDYKEVYGTNIKHPDIYSEHGNDSLANALGICCLIMTMDGKYLVFKRSKDVLELPGFYHLCAGHFERGKDSIERQVDILSAMGREISEEVSILQSQILAINAIGLCRSLLSYKPELLFTCKVALTSAAISKELLNFEHKEIILFDERELVLFLLKEHSTFVPAGKANIICHLISKYGIKGTEALLAAP